MFGHRAIYSDGWVATTTPLQAPWVGNPRPSDPINDWSWELYDITEDFSQSNNIASKHPEKLQEMQYLFYGEARKYGALPIDSSKTTRLDVRLRPSLTRGRDKFTYYDGMHRIPEGTAPDFKNKSYSVSAEIEIGKDNTDGMLATQGGRFGGWGLYIHEGRPKFVYNLANLRRTFIVGEPLSPGAHTIRYEFEYEDATKLGGGGHGTLFVDGKKVADSRIDQTMGYRISLDETFDIGADAGEPVSEDYHVPYDFEGKLNRVDVHLGDAALSN
jgi:arylsulfatase